ncbi:MAG: AraC family ligand binding domain-containing protein [Myxococcota bacterium]
MINGTRVVYGVAALALALASAACGTTGSAVGSDNAPAAATTMEFALPAVSDSDKPLEAKVVVDAPAAKIATVVLRKGTLMPEHHSPVAATIVALSGSGTVVSGTQRLRIDAGHAVLLAPGAPHSVEPDPGTDLVLLVHHLGRAHGEHE